MNTHKVARPCSKELFPVDPSKFVLFLKNNKIPENSSYFQKMLAIYCS